jgi:glucose/arabinose dehydrogenase/cytochrome c2
MTGAGQGTMTGPPSFKKRMTVIGMFAAAALSVAVAADAPAPVPVPVSAPALASAGQSFWVEQLADGLNAPWSMAWLPNGDMLIVEKFGGVRLFHEGKLEMKPLAGTPAAYQASVNGLLDIALDPDFAVNHRVFLAFTEGNAESAHGAVYRARFTGDALVDGKVIFRTKPDGKVPPFAIVGRMLFLPDKTFLLTSSDDEARRHLVQQRDNDLGKILRLDRDGRPPADNPFIGNRDVLPEIYAWGVRAPLGLARDPRSGQIWENENGPKGGDELNLIKRGANYGWPIATYGTEYTGEEITAVREAPGIEPPVTYWTPSIAPSGLALNTGDRYAHWRGDLFLGALAGQHLRRVRVQNGKVVEQEVLLKDLKERIRDVRLGPDGYLYLLTDNTEGRLLRLLPGSPTPEQAALAAKPKDKGMPSIFIGLSKAAPPDLAHGKILFDQQCSGCHSIDGAAARPGPDLRGVYGRKSGTLPGYAFSPAIRAAGTTWGQMSLDYFLAEPSGFVPGTTMTASAVQNPQARVDLIGYLRSVTP